MKIGLMKYVVIVMVVFPLYCSFAVAQDKIPKAEFVKYTEAALDAVDIVEGTLTNTEATVLEANKAIRDLDVALKKYDRFGKGPLKEPAPREIKTKLYEARLCYDIFIMGKDSNYLQKGMDLSQQVRNLFKRYKTK